jgi:curved DNA-binding protein
LKKLFFIKSCRHYLADTIKPIEFILPNHDAQGNLHEIKKTLNVKIPAGIADGERIRLKGHQY